MTEQPGISQPNIVVILADDLGFSDLGCYGGEDASPNLDRLARNGLRMTQMYNSARCCPSRASLLTGLYPHQAGVGDMMQPLSHPSYQGYLREDCLTIAEVLRSAGYRTYMSGKWHVGRDYPWGHAERWGTAGDSQHPVPTDRGFDHHFGTLTGAGSYYAPDTLTIDGSFIEPESLADDFYYTDAITDHSVSFIQDAARSQRPFFLYIAHVAPHWPLHARPDDIGVFRGNYLDGWEALRQERFHRQQAMGLVAPDTRLSAPTAAAPWREIDNRAWEDSRMAAYAAQVHRMDVGVGRVVAEIERLGLAENTLILFMSDNGGCAERLEARGELSGPLVATRDGAPVCAGNVVGLAPGAESTFMSYGAGWANVSNAPFRLFKSWVHEGGISTPFIAYWPGRIAPGSLARTPTHFVDVAPTIAELAHADWPNYRNGIRARRPAGVSFTDALFGREWRRDSPIYWEHEGNRAVRTGRWKLVAQQEGPWQLFDVGADRSEQIDVSSGHAAVVRDLEHAYDAWATAVGVVDRGTVRRWSASIPRDMDWSWVVHDGE